MVNLAGLLQIEWLIMQEAHLGNAWSVWPGQFDNRWHKELLQMAASKLSKYCAPKII